MTSNPHAETVTDWLEANVGTHDATDAAVSAVYAVLKLHRPMDAQRHFGDRRQCCMACDDGRSTPRWPCATLAAIAAEIPPAKRGA